MYTRRGDDGKTFLFGARRVSKDDPRVEAYGTIDELNTVIGVVIAVVKNSRVESDLKKVQRMLFVAGADAAAEIGTVRKVPRISPTDTLAVEKMTDDLARRLPNLTNFILPGGSQTGALLQFARSVCRRAERRLVEASRSTELNPALLPFFNRLSSYLFNLSRVANKLEGEKEEVWKG